mmetsp:Transcript_19631/g.55425  ORF Transcript_19631/g.55425 Transcript_19631/m.55425 type:complete len:426 (-) Transcript_19631:330-1607(-)
MSCSMFASSSSSELSQNSSAMFEVRGADNDAMPAASTDSDRPRLRWLFADLERRCLGVSIVCLLLDSDVDVPLRLCPLRVCDGVPMLMLSPLWSLPACGVAGCGDGRPGTCTAPGRTAMAKSRLRCSWMGFGVDVDTESWQAASSAVFAECTLDGKGGGAAQASSPPSSVVDDSIPFVLVSQLGMKKAPTSDMLLDLRWPGPLDDFLSLVLLATSLSVPSTPCCCAATADTVSSRSASKDWLSLEAAMPALSLVLALFLLPLLLSFVLRDATETWLSNPFDVAVRYAATLFCTVAPIAMAPCLRCLRSRSAFSSADILRLAGSSGSTGITKSCRRPSSSRLIDIDVPDVLLLLLLLLVLLPPLLFVTDVAVVVAVPPVVALVACVALFGGARCRNWWYVFMLRSSSSFFARTIGDVGWMSGCEGG